MEIEIREVRKSDYVEIVGLMGELGYPTSLQELIKRFDALRKHGDYDALVAVKENRAIGFAGLCKALAFEFTGPYARILAFVVSSTERNQGVGFLLITACEEWARKQGANHIVLTSGNREERHAAHAFYKKNGFIAKSTGFSKVIS